MQFRYKLTYIQTGFHMRFPKRKTINLKRYTFEDIPHPEHEHSVKITSKIIRFDNGERFSVNTARFVAFHDPTATSSDLFLQKAQMRIRAWDFFSSNNSHYRSLLKSRARDVTLNPARAKGRKTETAPPAWQKLKIVAECGS